MILCIHISLCTTYNPQVDMDSAISANLPASGDQETLPPLFQLVYTYVYMCEISLGQ